MKERVKSADKIIDLKESVSLSGHSDIPKSIWSNYTGAYVLAGMAFAALLVLMYIKFKRINF